MHRDTRKLLGLIGFTVIAFIGLIVAFARMPSPPRSHVVVFEDGSGVQYVNGRHALSFDEDTFVWDCRYMGNKVCATDQ